MPTELQTLIDRHLEIQLDADLDPDDEDERLAEIEQRIEALGGWGDALPSALERCPYCDDVRDRRPGGEIALCLCAGIACRACGAGRVRRPVSDHYDPHEHALWHTPHFGGHATCRWCQATPPSTSLRAAAEALGQPRSAADAALPRHDLVALRGGVEDWHDLRLGAPPDGRPLFVGRSLATLELRSTPAGLGVATWRAPRGGAGAERVLEELLVRWQPPLNREIETPWS